MTPWEQLRDDPRTWDAIDSLLDRGLCEEHVFPLLQHLASLDRVWEQTNKNEESPVDRHKRHQALAKKVQSLAQEIELDMDAKHYRIFDHESVTTTPITGRPTVADFLREFAENVCPPGKSPETQSTRNELKSFVQREAAKAIYDLLDRPKRAPVGDTVQLVHVILGSDATTSEQMKQVFANLRKGED